VRALRGAYVAHATEVAEGHQGRAPLRGDRGRAADLATDGSEWGKITVEDFHGTATVLAFGEAWQKKHREVLKQDAPVLIRGAVSGRERDEEDPPLFLDGAR
jgi:hypothetical protein